MPEHEDMDRFCGYCGEVIPDITQAELMRHVNECEISEKV